VQIGTGRDSLHGIDSTGLITVGHGRANRESGRWRRCPGGFEALKRSVDTFWIRRRRPCKARPLHFVPRPLCHVYIELGSTRRPSSTHIMWLCHALV
jgi:hypothetical protein